MTLIVNSMTIGAADAGHSARFELTFRAHGKGAGLPTDDLLRS